MKVKNAEYRQFLDKGIITLITPEHIEKVLAKVDGIRGKHKLEGRALIIALYYTGARPAEILNIEAGHVERDNTYVKIFIKGQVKRSLPRHILIKRNKPFINELFEYTKLFAPNGLIFHHYRNTYHRSVQTRRQGIIVRDETTNKLYYHLRRWFEDVINITPYVLRHSKFSKLMQKGATAEDIRQLKGARRLDSVMPYLHMSMEKSKKLARLNE